MFVHRYKDIIKISNLLETWERFLKGKRHKKDVMLFQSDLALNLAGLHFSLAKYTYKHGQYSAFNVSDPKPRNIHKAEVRDRVLHHLIYKELYPYFEKRFIFDSYSCREGKGVHRALNRLKRFAGKVSKNHSRTCYVLKCDIKKFFASIDHKILKKILKRHIEDSDIIWLINRVISSFYSIRPGLGLPLGNLTSQLLVNIYMHEFDIYVKQELGVKYYIRYADDFIILSDNKDYLNSLLLKISDFLQKKLKLSLHERKVCIKTYASGVDFLGWVHFPYHRQLRTATKRKIARKLKGYPKRETIISYQGLLSHGNTYKFKKRLGLGLDE
ncbi:MAG: reverse transcriptase/maturase family protein [Patescibacteria group bacterium]|nr:reverse transcriptase/maturase family protein [Patescibacteria group bacterium]